MNGLEAYVGGYAVARSVPGGVQIWLNTVTVFRAAIVTAVAALAWGRTVRNDDIARKDGQ